MDSGFRVVVALGGAPPKTASQPSQPVAISGPKAPASCICIDGWKSLFDGKTLNGWKFYAGKANIDSGAIVLQDGADLYYPAKWTKFALECEVISDTGSPLRRAVGLHLGQLGTGRSPDLYRLRLLLHGDGDFEVTRDADRLWKSGRDKFPINDWLRVKLELTDKTLSVYREGKLLHKIDVSSLPARAGGILFYGLNGGTVRIRNIRVHYDKPWAKPGGS